MTLLAVPNISEGRDTDLIASIAGTTALLDVSSDVDHNRTVLTYGGTPTELADALSLMIERAAAALDLRTHDGVHPRYGVVDVLPIVPYGGGDTDARRLVDELSWRIANGPSVPLFPYGRAAADGLTLPRLRRRLRDRPGPQHPSAGVICIGIRDPLIAFNVNLDAPLASAVRIANDVRTDAVRALGFPLPSRDLVQVSMNLVAPLVVGPRAAFDSVATHGPRVVDAEVVGLVPAPTLTQFRDLPMAGPVRSIEDAFAQASGG